MVYTLSHPALTRRSKPFGTPVICHVLRHRCNDPYEGSPNSLNPGFAPGFVP
jgi:hypothetical protein